MTITKKISELPFAAALNGAELVELVQAGANVQSTTEDIIGLVPNPGILIPNSESSNYTTILTDVGKMLLHPNGAGAGDTVTIAANASVAYQIGTAMTFVNRDSNNWSIAIASDTLIKAGSTTTGTRTLAQNGVCTALKVESTVWLISGTGLT